MIKTTYELVNPEYARYILENHNPRNRKFKKNKITLFANDMKAGKWKDNTGESIKFDWNGSLLDGQNRLKAVILSGVSIDFEIKHGLDPSVFDVIDTGAPRSGADTLFINGVKNPSQVSAIISLCLSRDSTPGSMSKGRNKTKSSNSAILEEFNKNSEYWININKSAVRYSARVSKYGTGIITATEIGFWLHTFIKADGEQMANSFWGSFSIPEAINEAPNILFKMLTKNATATKKYTYTNRAKLISEAWNKYVTGASVRSLRIKKGDIVILKRRNF